LKIFVCEFITGGGLYREPLPPSLLREGEMMLQALLSDLLAVPGIELITTRDARLPPLTLPISVFPIPPTAQLWQCWEECIASADAVWPIAPESGGMLERLSRLIVAHGKVLLGCSPDAVATAASKSATATALVAAGIPVVPTYPAKDWFGRTQGPWVAKPDDGIGCTNIRLFDSTDELHAWLGQGGRAQTHIVQPYLAGEAASLSLITHGKTIHLLSCNRQLIEVRNGEFHYCGSILNDMAQYWQACEAIARNVVYAIPGLVGHVGIDVVIHEGAITVIEVNPRLTTSYGGLRQATGLNPARLILDMFYNEQLPRTRAITRNIVEISLDE
jgi:predicted ATP-grasp superfamily ATP-dependent carboligase